MNRTLWVALMLCLVGFWCLPGGVHAASSATYTGGGWTLKLTFGQAAYGQTMSGRFYSGNKSYPVHGDWIPAGDAGSDLLRFYGHPFGPRSAVGLVGVATLANTCTPNCATSRHYKLTAVPLYRGTTAKLPGVGKASLVVLIH